MWGVDHSEIDEPEDNQGEYQALEIDETEKSLVFGFYSQIKNQKDHFYSMQFTYRYLASSWMLFFFAGLGFVLSKHSNVDLPMDSLLAVSFLDILTLLAILLIWHLDIVLYQKFWVACVIELAEMEKKHSWLSHINRNILYITKIKKFNFFQSYFYIAFVVILMIIFICSSSFYVYAIKGTLFSSITFAIGTLFLFIIPYLMSHFSKKQLNINL